MEAVDIHARDIVLRAAVLYPSRQQTPNTPARQNAYRIKPSRHEIPPNLRGLAYNGAAIGRETLRPAEELFHAADRAAGTRAMAFSTKGVMRSQSGWISPKEKSGTWDTFHAAAWVSKSPTSSPPPSGLM
eukprot:CAMPEP_0173342140 /NCGR_PEP_ID=MMETSP1144-20121109/10020_1 /TAXON_ID=483371 /ORGANISM="non described non described, Strain CCMP2298" /LENGTH=129 /DNA_ID=CAMNT_0014288657 /DNA_START=512 /DNA_END=902 /DNA_ORIENTATION=+